MDHTSTAAEPFERISTGISGLDEILHGGLPKGGVFLVEGDPGSGKTTLGLQFLLEGARQGDSCLFISLSQPEATLERIAASHGWSLDDVSVRGLTPRELVRGHDEPQDVFLPEDVELVDLTERVQALVADTRPDRIVFDSLTFVRILAFAPGRYRQELVSLIEYLREQDATTLLTLATDGEFEASDAHAITDGIIRLQQIAADYGSKRFRMIVRKLRASDFRGGYQDFQIIRGGLEVFPRVIPMRSGDVVPRSRFGSGLDELDEMVGGGLAAGTSCLIIGPSGVGKTTMATTYIHAAAERGTKSAIFLFEELRPTFLERAKNLGMDLVPHIEAGTVIVEQVEGALVSPGEFSVMVREVIDDDLSILVIDSLTGYFQSMPAERTLIAQVRDLIRHMNRREVLSILTVAQRGLVGEELQSPLDISESADVAILMRYFETQGRLRKAMSVVKKRYGRHEADVRELVISKEGLRVGEATHAFSGILSGIPRFEGTPAELMDDREP